MLPKQHLSYCRNLLFYDLQNFHGACLGTDAAGDALGSGIAFLHDHNLHGAGFHTLAALYAQLLVDHVHTGLLILGDSAGFASLHALAALNADSGLGIAILCNAHLNAAKGHIEFLVEGFGASLYALQASHALGVFLNSELLHSWKLSFTFLFTHNIIYAKYKKINDKNSFFQTFWLAFANHVNNPILPV